MRARPHHTSVLSLRIAHLLALCDRRGGKTLTRGLFGRQAVARARPIYTLYPFWRTQHSSGHVILRTNPPSHVYGILFVIYICPLFRASAGPVCTIRSQDT